ncbi:MAG: LLM class flavin-dependent oxidoreductase [Thermomicrobiales bacterium]
MRLEFGTFITPASDDPARVVDLAVLSEAFGYDLVTVQDHPYNPGLLDAWTLLGWIAGKIERIRLSANVINLPLRPPAVLARSAASLDLLSDGRVEVGLGAGAFWPAIAAMGGPVWTPAEAVQATSEAIDIMRELWDAGTRRNLRFHGEVYTVDGASRGPLPRHDIPIWLGAHKPRMLRLIGRKADGWSVTFGYLPTGDERGEFRRGNAIIDEAARAVGRDPREIRRIVNIAGTFQAQSGEFLQGPPAQWVDDLAPLAIEDGVSTFVLMTDDDTTMQTFAQEVIPALRERVGAALPADLGILRPARARAKRREGIAYDEVPASLREGAIEPGDLAYARVRNTYMRGGAPGIVLKVSTVTEVREALAFARRHPDLPFGVRSGGHGISGRSTNDGGIIIDLSGMNRIEVIGEQKRLVRIEPGARWMDVAVALEPHGWALTSGDYGGVGVGGLATAGGVGFLAREQGLTIDHTRAAEIVLADGTLLRASDTENPDLFWAIRGAGANFGIVTAFEFLADPVSPQMGWAQFVMDASDTAGFLERWGAAVEGAPRALTSELIIGAPRRGQPLAAMVLALVDSDDPQVIVNALQPLADIAPLYQQQVYLTTYANVMANASREDHNGQGEPVARSGIVRHITPRIAQQVEQLILNRGTYFFQIRSLGGAVNDADPEAMAFSHRTGNFVLSAMGSSRARLDSFWTPMQAQFAGLYLNFETDVTPDRIDIAFPPRVLDRLRLLKAKYDPYNVFRDNFNIAPARTIALGGGNGDPVPMAASVAPGAVESAGGHGHA